MANTRRRTADCTAHFIRTDILTAGVTANLKKITSYATKHEAKFMKLLTEQNEDSGKWKNAARKRKLEITEKRIAEVNAIFKRLYEDSVSRCISDERFMELSTEYEQEQAALKARRRTPSRVGQGTGSQQKCGQVYEHCLQGKVLQTITSLF